MTCPETQLRHRTSEEGFSKQDKPWALTISEERFTRVRQILRHSNLAIASPSRVSIYPLCRLSVGIKRDVLFRWGGQLLFLWFRLLAQVPCCTKTLRRIFWYSWTRVINILKVTTINNNNVILGIHTYFCFLLLLIMTYR